MTETRVNSTSKPDDEPVSGFALAVVLLRWRRLILILAALGCALGLLRGLTTQRVYKSTATFIPEGGQGSASGLASLAASQLGVSISASGGAWTPQMYLELIRSRAVLLPIVLDTLVVAEDGGKRATLIDLLKITSPKPELRVNAAVEALGRMIEANEDRKLGAVTFSVSSAWPSVSLALAQRVADRINNFNIETRKSQALAERQFVETQVVESEAALRNAENRLQAFLQGNREIAGSPSLSFERDRLQREVGRLSQLYTSWLQSREEARIREIRDTPVITVLEAPRLPLIGEPRKSINKAIIWGSAGAILGAILAFLSEGLAMMRNASSVEAREFFRTLDEATPAFIKRRRR